MKSTHNRVITGSSDGQIKLWDLVTAKCLLTLKVEGQPVRIDLASGVADEVLVQTSNGTILSISLAGARQATVMSSSGINCFAVGEGVIYTGNADHSIQVYEKEVAKTPFTGHSKAIEQLKYYPPGLLVSSARGGEIRVWNAMKGTSVVTTQGEQFSLVETVDTGATLVVLDSAGISLVNIQETVKALKVQNAIAEADSGLTSELYLAHCDLTALPAELLSNKRTRHVTELHINNNAIQRLGSGLAKLRGLRTIEAQNNKLTSVASAICSKLTHIETLLLGSNELSYIPGEIGRLEKLDLLDLSQNKLEYLPASLAALRELTTLFLHDNYLGGIPDPSEAMGMATTTAAMSLSESSSVINPDRPEMPAPLRTAQSALLSPRTPGHSPVPSLSSSPVNGTNPAPRIGSSALGTGSLAAMSLPISARNLSLKPTISFRSDHGAMRSHIASARDLNAASSASSSLSPPVRHGQKGLASSAGAIATPSGKSGSERGEKGEKGEKAEKGERTGSSSSAQTGSSTPSRTHLKTSKVNVPPPSANDEQNMDLVSPRSPRKEPKGDRSRRSRQAAEHKRRPSKKLLATTPRVRNASGQISVTITPDSEFVSPALRNASLRKSLHRYNTASKVSAKYSDLTDLAAVLSSTEGNPLPSPTGRASSAIGAASNDPTTASADTAAGTDDALTPRVRIIDGIVKSPSSILAEAKADEKTNTKSRASSNHHSVLTSDDEAAESRNTSDNNKSTPGSPRAEGLSTPFKSKTGKRAKKKEKETPKEKGIDHDSTPNSPRSINGDSSPRSTNGGDDVTPQRSPRKLGSPNGAGKKSKRTRNGTPSSDARPSSTTTNDVSPNGKEIDTLAGSSHTSGEITSLPLERLRQPPATPKTRRSPRNDDKVPVLVRRGREEYLTEDVIKSQVFFEDLDFAQMSSLKLLHLQANALESLPKSLGFCSALTDLDLAENRLTDFSEALCRLTGLVRLSLVSNEIASLPEAFTQLSRLQELYLDENQLESLPAGVATSWGSLRVLHLSHNSLASLPHNIGKLPHLTELNLSHNEIRSFPTELTQLKPLTFLAIDGNGMKELPAELFFLPNLKSLEARENQLTTVPYASLIHVECLQLDENLIDSISPDIAQLQKVADLSFSGNPVREIAEEVGALTNLIRLDLSQTPLLQIPESICLLPKLRKLILIGNEKLTWPAPEMVEELETEALLEWMQQDRFGALKPNDKHRVCFIGLESSGKSTLFYHLKNGKGSKRLKPTRGIEFDTWSPKITVDASDLDEGSSSSQSSGFDSSSSASSNTTSPGLSRSASEVSANTTTTSAGTVTTRLTFNVWDFSGGEDYRPLHQLFVNDGAVYVLCWNLALDESRSTIPYWLNTIRAHAGSRVPVLIVATHMDQLKPADAEKALCDLHAKYGGALHALTLTAPAPPSNSTASQMYPNVRAIIGVSATSGMQLDKVAKKICALALELRRGSMVPLAFQKVLAALPKDLPPQGHATSPVMELHLFEKFLAKFGLDEFASTAALRYLAESGAVVHLPRTHFLDLGGVITDVATFVRVYTDIFSARQKHISEGILKHDQLEQIWKDSGLPVVAHYTLIAVLHKLEICFDDGNLFQKSSRNFYANMSFFPSFMPDSPPDPWPLEVPQWNGLSVGSQEISLAFRFASIPASFMPKLMTRIFSRLRPLVHWKSGFLVQSQPDVLQPNAEPEMSAYLEVTQRCDVRVWIRGSHMYSCMNLLVDALLKVVASYKEPPAVSVQRHLQCAFKTNKETQVELVAVSMHKVEYEISRGVTVLQLTTGGQIPLTHIHADMAAPITEFTTI